MSIRLQWQQGLSMIFESGSIHGIQNVLSVVRCFCRDGFCFGRANGFEGSGAFGHSLRAPNIAEIIVNLRDVVIVRPELDQAAGYSVGRSFLSLFNKPIAL